MSTHPVIKNALVEIASCGLAAKHLMTAARAAQANGMPVTARYYWTLVAEIAGQGHDLLEQGPGLQHFAGALKASAQSTT